MAKELSVMNIKGIDYNLVDSTARTLIQEMYTTIENQKNVIDAYREGILELARQVTILKDNETVRKTCLAVDDVSSFPILKFNSDFSILVDITISIGNEIHSSQQILKYYNGKIYRNILDSDCTIDVYYQIKDNQIYFFFDIYHDKYNLALNIISYDGNIPNIIIDEDKFSTTKYAYAKKLK